ncbi:MAG: hypothetical protein A2329_06020 [Sulfurimonas sp. RIFOXYB2_FULL_37_5]|nr:MAG: hypothetical protein A2417_02000 [Bdellovibrionales bacterium RIFOXYC1_FULL_37_79]OFZ58824.1 MAG: hypothetical protein A2381_01145 [Bdellovibrionales bacterium RIFOXYB1_FULL_37_110]OFZ64823.1 MAG: hypothetical protein A2577_07145 [Bdellovibrionales bacterium RIFOXYD1_FULL_36_51]OHE08037.1 MAG: hypothetical protein A2329_06020 [Sulfurimonas sp. RIFOXYB2_FULL_37_5]
MNICVVGYGSIGKRHTDILSSKGHNLTIVSKQENLPFESYTNLQTALDNNKNSFDLIIIATPTSKHAESLKTLNANKFIGKILIEKPIAAASYELADIDFNVLRTQTFVGYNLRFHPLIQFIKKELQNQTILSFHAYVGQYLPTWRPNQNYKESYSAHKNLGGGVLRDLSHELDYAIWLLGQWTKLTAQVQKASDLEIDTDDQVAVLFQTKRCPSGTIILNYNDQITQRKITINTFDKTFEIDLINNKVQINNDTRLIPVPRNETYKLMLEDILQNNTTNLCSIDEGLNILNLIESIEKASKEEIWVTNPSI